MGGNSMFDINNPSSYKRTNKKKYQIWASMPPEGTKVRNYLEKVEYITTHSKQFVLTGTVGEKWVTDINKLCATYRLADGRALSKDVLGQMVVKGYTAYTPGAVPVIKPFKIESLPGVPNWALFVPKQYVFQIPTARGDVLTVNDPNIPHGAGDFIVCGDNGFGEPNLADRWVVNGNVFPHTYDMRSFPNHPVDYKNQVNLGHDYTEFKGVVFNQIHQTAICAGVIRDSKKAQEVYMNMIKGICMELHKTYGAFVKPPKKTGIGVITIPLGNAFDRKHINFRFRDDEGEYEMRVDVHTGNRNSPTETSYFTINTDNIGMVMDFITDTISSYGMI